MGNEIKEFIKEAVTRMARNRELQGVESEDIVKMRYVITWKVDPASLEGKKAKVRLVILGFQDPHLGQEQTLAPTMVSGDRPAGDPPAHMFVRRTWQTAACRGNLKGWSGGPHIGGLACAPDAHIAAPRTTPSV